MPPRNYPHNHGPAAAAGISADAGKSARARERASLLVFPREHGAWGILLVPLVVGGWLGYRPGSLGALLLFTALVLLLFLLRTPLESWLGGGVMRAQNDAERGLVRRWAAMYALAAAPAAGALLWLVPAGPLLGLGAVAALCGLGQAGLRRLRRETRVAAQAVGAIGLTATAPAAYYVASGTLGQTAGVLWLVNWLFAAHQIHYVHLRIGAARAGSRAAKLRQGRGFLGAQAVLLGVLAALAASPYASLVLLVAFAPAMARAAAWFAAPPAPLAVHRLGVMELVQNLLFGALLIAGMQGWRAS